MEPTAAQGVPRCGLSEDMQGEVTVLLVVVWVCLRAK